MANLVITLFLPIGESIILGAAAAAFTADRNRQNIPQLVRHPSQQQMVLQNLLFLTFCNGINIFQ